MRHDGIASPDIKEITTFVDKATPNDKFTYYTGFNLKDSLLSEQLQMMVYKYSVRGSVYLVQGRHRLYPGMFNYIMIKASYPPLSKLVPFSDEKLDDLQKVRG